MHVYYPHTMLQDGSTLHISIHRRCMEGISFLQTFIQSGRLSYLWLLIFLLGAISGNTPSVAHAENNKALVDAIIQTGIDRDNIPALLSPKYVAVSDAALSLAHDEPVFVLELPQEVRIYPQYLMVWHEVLNENTPDDKPIMLTYSPLAGSVAAYSRQAGRFTPIFGVKGTLLNANTILYDRATHSLWPQITGKAIEGMLENTSLSPLPVLWTTWQRAAKRWPNALVLSRATGYRRTYGKDPYGSYRDAGSYYHNNSLTFPVIHRDTRLAAKEPILGIKIHAQSVAIHKAKVKEEGAVNFAMGPTPMVAVYDKELDAIRIFSRLVEGNTLSFFMRNDTLTDRETQSEWNAEGKSLFGSLRDQQLTRIPNIEVMWFAWVAFYPKTAIIPSEANIF